MSRVVISAAATSCFGDRELGAVVSHAADARRACRPVARRARRSGRGCRLGFVRVAGRLAVEAQVRGRLLDHAVRLAGHDERVVGQADVERLAAAAQRELEPVGIAGGGRADRDGAVERGDRPAERLGRLEPLAEAAAISVGMTFASVVISGRIVEPVARR